MIPLDDYQLDIDDLLVDRKSIQHLECSICLDLLKQPYQCTQGHIFCLVCIRKHSERSKECPLCKCNFGILSRSLLSEKFINDLQVYCKYAYKISNSDTDVKKEEEEEDLTNNNKKQDIKRKIEKKYEYDQEGCREKIRYGDMDQHHQQCKYGWVQCKFNSDGCKPTRRNDIEMHYKECRYRLINCELCNEEIRFIDTEKHNLVCLKMVIECTECKVKLERGLMKDHLDNDCLEHEIECPFDSTLCKTRMKRKDAERHLKDQLVAHLTVQNNHLSKQVVLMQTKLNTLIEAFSNQSQNEFKWIKRFPTSMIDLHSGPFVIAGTFFTISLIANRVSSSYDLNVKPVNCNDTKFDKPLLVSITVQLDKSKYFPKDRVDITTGHVCLNLIPFNYYNTLTIHIKQINSFQEEEEPF